jgi:hypothetical protein
MSFNPELGGNERLKKRWNTGEYNELIPLRKKLLSISGREMVPSKEPDLDRIISKGDEINPHNIIFTKGRSNECHENSALLYKNGESITEIGTGWALSDDGLWRQHSWAMRGSELVETTVERSVYYGILLKNDEAQEFINKNIY